MKGWHESTARQRQRGFTLIEQIVLMCVLVTLACIAAPALGQLLDRSQLQAAQSDLLVALQHTRGLAIHSGRRAMLCPSRDGEHCSDEWHWDGGWLVGHYRSERTDQLDGTPNLAAGSHERLTILSTTGRRRIRFQADGTARGSNVAFTLCRRGRSDGALTVTVSSSGRIYSPKATRAQADRCAGGG